MVFLFQVVKAELVPETGTLQPIDECKTAPSSGRPPPGQANLIPDGKTLPHFSHPLTTAAFISLIITSILLAILPNVLPDSGVALVTSPFGLVATLSGVLVAVPFTAWWTGQLGEWWNHAEK